MVGERIYQTLGSVRIYLRTKLKHHSKRYHGLKPAVSVLVETLRVLNMYGGAPPVVAGTALVREYEEENVELVEKKWKTSNGTLAGNKVRGLGVGFLQSICYR